MKSLPEIASEESIEYIYNMQTQTVHAWPGCSRVGRMDPTNAAYWSSREYGEARQERGVIHRCRICFGKPKAF